MLARARLAEEAKAEAELRAKREVESRRAAAHKRLERARKLRAMRASAEQHADEAGVRPGRLTVFLYEAAIGVPALHGSNSADNFRDDSGRFFVTMELESLEMTSEVIEGPDPAFQQLFTIPVLHETELHLQVANIKINYYPGLL